MKQAAIVLIKFLNLKKRWIKRHLCMQSSCYDAMKWKMIKEKLEMIKFELTLLKLKTKFTMKLLIKYLQCFQNLLFQFRPRSAWNHTFLTNRHLASRQLTRGDTKAIYPKNRPPESQPDGFTSTSTSAELSFLHPSAIFHPPVTFSMNVWQMCC